MTLEALHRAAISGNISDVQEIKEFDFRQANPTDGNTPLMTAVMFGQLNVLEHYLSHCSMTQDYFTETVNHEGKKHTPASQRKRG